MPYFLQYSLIVVAIILTIGLAGATFSGRRGFGGLRSWAFFLVSLLSASWAVYLIRRINLNGGYDGYVYKIFTLVFLAVLVSKIVFSIYQAKKSRIKKEKRGYNLTSIAYSVMACTVFVFNIILPFMFGYSDLIWMGIIGFFAFDILILINIIKNDHFDLKESFMHIVMYSFVIAFVVSVYLLAMKVVYQFVFHIVDISFEFYMINTILAVIIILLLPLINEANYFIKRYIYVDSYNIDKLVAKMSHEIIGAKDIERTLEAISRMIIKELCVGGAYFVIMRSPEEISFVQGRTKRGLNQEEIFDVVNTIILGNSSLLKQDVIVVDDLPSNLPATKILRERHFSAIAKMFTIDKEGKRKLAGFLLVNQKQHHRKLGERGRKALAIIAGLTVVAINNAENYSLLKQKENA
jgi:hypothetical protein